MRSFRYLNILKIEHFSALLIGVTLVHVSKYIQDAKKKHTTDLEVQMRYNEANDKSIGRQTEKVKDMEDTCRMIMHDIRSAMEEDPQPPARKNSEDELRAKVVTEADRVKLHLSPLLRRFKELLMMQQKFQDMAEHTRYAIMLTGRDPARYTVKQALEDYITEQEEHALILRKEAQTYKGELDSKDGLVKGEMKFKDRQMGDLEEQLRNLKSELARKDTAVRSKDAEIQKLLGRISTLEQLVNKLRSQQPGARRPSQGRFPDVKDSSRLVLIELGGNKKEIQSSNRLSLPAINKGGKITMHDSGLRTAAEPYHSPNTLAPIPNATGGRSKVKLQIDREPQTTYQKGHFGGAQRKGKFGQAQQYAR